MVKTQNQLEQGFLNWVNVSLPLKEGKDSRAPPTP